MVAESIPLGYRKRAKRMVRGVLESISAVRPRHWDSWRLVRAQAGGAPAPVQPDTAALRRAMEWLKAAQDATVDGGGVSWGYVARAPVRYGMPLGWQPAYPETTGYIIETMLRYSRLTGDGDCGARARRMAEWELGIQLPDGGFQGGVMGAEPVASSTFVTGQVMFGLLSAYQEEGD